LIALLTALTLAVPYLPQTEALCGGAAAAMVFRYLGDRHADVQQFQPLVDARAGGIADTALIDAIRSRGWHAERLDGSIAAIRAHVDAGQPLILLIEDRPSRYHYVVAVGADEEQVWVHDPTWGPARRMTASELLRRWKPTRFWTLLVTRGDESTADARGALTASAKASASRPDLTLCDRLLHEALDKIDISGPGVAGEALEAVRRQCPTASAPLSELAGVRFSQKRWHEAAELAEQALDRDPENSYAWDVLGSSRFVQDDMRGALEAWNHIGKPRLDSIQIAGLTRTRYAFVAAVAGLTPNAVLTAGQLSLADRRLSELPDRVTGSIGYRPDSDGFATVNVDVVERSRGPRGLVDWASLGTQAAINREVAVTIPGTSGQGEIWNASWRWWGNRPRVAASFTAPRAGRLAGLWRVEGSWEAQTYRAQQAAGTARDLRQQQARGALSFSTWLFPDLRAEASSGLDTWDLSDSSGSQRTAFVAGTIEQRFAVDRMSVAASTAAWSPIGEGSSFYSASVRAGAQSSAQRSSRPIAVLAHVRADFASAEAPLAIWPGAGDGRARPGLLRAHPLLDDGVIDGPVFGRQAQTATLELQRWLTRPEIPRFGVAVFADAAHASSRLDPAAGRSFQLDLGTGVRFRLPGNDRTFRIDYASGLRDRHARAITVGIATSGF
jgi:hypothetical protein